MNRQRILRCSTIPRQLRVGSQVQRKRHAGRESMRELKRRRIGDERRMRVKAKPQMWQGLIPLVDAEFAAVSAALKSSWSPIIEYPS